jgi:hypothetical protein
MDSASHTYGNSYKFIEGVFSLIPPFVIEKETPVAHRDCYPAFLTTQPPFQEKKDGKSSHKTSNFRPGKTSQSWPSPN